MSFLTIPNRLVVLTFDDGNKSDVTYVAPLLKQYGFGATFYITEGLNFLTNKEHYVTWEEVRQLHQAGFEIGNHTRNHKNVNNQTPEEFLADLEHLDLRCQQYGIPVPETFCYPGYNHGSQSVESLTKKGMCFARRGVAPEFPYESEGGRGPAYDPKVHHRLLIPTTGASGPNWGFDDFVWALEQAKDERITVLTFHGVPALEHPWVNTNPDQFKTYMDFMNDHEYTIIALRDLSKYVDPKTNRTPIPTL
ncbi:TPA: polysaccharide deacetylase family protein [Candidatus Poribacteria bacterium]|jgi:peptidoglycan/xylan/chitin deacetylase (PgdA/CDA1 family)|nr:polysaccharide deacetylase family protein [Candidatus Poribacteria bacterium]HIB86717.1 polysaccharide deacetylase family protein [Candidatus Poribacteria bacterium]HIB99541.1 polysaccharide deacetylase family protein [Candidatus Poribacteria bacterium]HIM10583.1 polysaccharide deacetylase family protein [Candidatus Poribacteria bacterium]HIN28309.1 polysaccharide deacetylase family protein [Candidatus Poribacteria bacterium]